ncbi:unnamed protein product, partial [Prorocentrum cordatum]
ACPIDEEAAAELRSLRGASAAAAPAEGLTAASSLMSVVARELFPRVLEDCPRSQEARLDLAAECWERGGRAGDVEGAGLYVAACLAMGETRRSHLVLEELLDAGVDMRLAFEPRFLEVLQEKGLLAPEHAAAPTHGSLQALVQRAAALARRCGGAGVFVRRHGALLLAPPADAGPGAVRVLAEGFNHPAPPLGPRGMDKWRGLVRTFASAEEAADAGLRPRLCRPRPSQRHAEVHCLLQLPRLGDAAGGSPGGGLRGR